MQNGAKVQHRFAPFRIHHSSFRILQNSKPLHILLNCPNPANADWKGWIPMENLILWDQSMVTDFGIPIRCVLASGILDRGASDDAGKLYKNPVSPKDYELLPNIPNSVFYILKTEGDKVLLSLAKELGENASNLYGWVSRLSILRWNTRLAVEPNWDPSFVEDFASKGVTSQLLETEICTKEKR